MPVRPSDIEDELRALRTLVERLVADSERHAADAIRRLESDLAATRAGRDDLAAALGVVSSERDRAMAQVRAMSDRLDTILDRLEDLTRERDDLAARVEEARRRSEDAREHDPAVSGP